MISLQGGDTTDYRSCVVKASYYCRDIGSIASAGKELACGMHAPTNSHEKDLHRLARFPGGKTEHCAEQKAVRDDSGSRVLGMMCDVIARVIRAAVPPGFLQASTISR